jgi:transcription antitermination factor NusG
MRAILDNKLLTVVDNNGAPVLVYDREFNNITHKQRNYKLLKEAFDVLNEYLDNPFSVGDRVRVSLPLLAPTYEGTVIEVDKEQAVVDIKVHTSFLTKIDED